MWHHTTQQSSREPHTSVICEASSRSSPHVSLFSSVTVKHHQPLPVSMTTSHHQRTLHCYHTHISVWKRRDLHNASPVFCSEMKTRISMDWTWTFMMMMMITVTRSRPDVLQRDTTQESRKFTHNTCISSVTFVLLFSGLRLSTLIFTREEKTHCWPQTIWILLCRRTVSDVREMMSITKANTRRIDLWWWDKEMCVVCVISGWNTPFSSHLNHTRWC